MTILSEGLRKRLAEDYDLTTQAKLELQRGEVFQEVAKACTRNGKTDLTKALGVYFHLDKEFAREFSWVMTRKYKNDIFQRHFDRFSSVSSDGLDGYQRASAPVDADSYNGDADIDETIVNKAIMARLEEESPIFDYVKVKNTNGFTAIKFPTFSSNSAATYKAKGATFDDFTDTANGITGLDNVVVEPQKIGYTADFEAEAFVKLDPNLIADIVYDMTVLYRRGVLNGLYLGSGAPSPTGMFTNATAIAYGSSATETLGQMVGAVGDTARSVSGLFAVTNLAGASVLLREKLNNESFNLNIALNQGLAGTVLGVPLIIDNSFQASGSSPAKTAPLYIGVKDHYLWAEGLAPKVEVDEFSNFKSGLQTFRIMGINGGKPAFNDSFAKTTIPSVY